MRNEGYILKKTNIDDLDQRISIKAAIRQQGTKGNVTYTYGNQPRCTVWASVKAYDAKNVNGEAEDVNEIDYKIIMRYRADVVYPDRVIWQGKTLRMVHAPINVEGRNKWLQLNCREFVQS